MRDDEASLPIGTAEPEFELVGEPVELGIARVRATADGRALWRLPVDVAERLWRCARAGIGGFERAGIDDGGPWLVRGPLEPSLRSLLQTAEPRPWAEIAAGFTSLARALAACEARALFPGRLSPRGVLCRGSDTWWLAADAWVRGQVGAPEEPEAARLTPWSAPELQAGGSWSNAANRYVFGLLLYRALSGRHPFEHRGLRSGAGLAPPPVDPAIVQRWPTGLHAWLLSLLDPVVARRPVDAQALVRGLVDLDGAADRPRSARPLSEVAGHRGSPSPLRARIEARERQPAMAEPTPASTMPEASRGPRLRGSWVSLAIPALAGVLAAVLGGRDAPSEAVSPPSVDAMAPLPSHPTVDDCASCHPREVSQWHGSVMAHANRSPLFSALEIVIQEQVGRSFACPHGAGILREADGATACVDPGSGLPITGSGGPSWCVNCHVPKQNLEGKLAAWDGRAATSSSRHPLPDLLSSRAKDGIDCMFCHQVHGPVRPGDERRGSYEGNPAWISSATGAVFSMRPEADRGEPGLANSGYALDPRELLGQAPRGVPWVHGRPSPEARAYLNSSEFCGSCHDVRLFGTDVLGVQRGEHFKRLRNAYSEWRAWADDRTAAGQPVASCQDCHMSGFPGRCVDAATPNSGPDPSNVALRRACPSGTRFEPLPPGHRFERAVAVGSSRIATVATHYFTGVDIPLSASNDPRQDRSGLDADGVPQSARARRDMLLGSAFRFVVEPPARRPQGLEIPIQLTNVGAGHKVPAGFSQEREIWIHLRVEDAAGRVLYEVGRVDRPDQDLADKRFVRVNVDDRFVDGQGQPLGVFGADVADGPDVPLWSPPLHTGATSFRGRGLVNLQNGFLRCVRCIGFIDGAGRCQPLPGQESHRAGRYDDGGYDLETGECSSNLAGDERFLEVYFPVGALDSRRGVVRGPDAIIDTRAAPPGRPLRFVYELPLGPRTGPLKIQARLLFRAFPPFLVRAFADYEALKAAQGLRPSGPLVTAAMVEELEIVELHRVDVEVP